MATVIVLYVLIAAGLAAGVTWVVVTARVGAANARRTVDDEVYAAIEDAMAEVAARAAADRDAAVQHALQQAAVLNREQLGTAASGVQADLAAKKDVIGTHLDQIHGELRSELERLGELVSDAGHGERGALRPGRRVAAGARRDHRRARPPTQSLREALANSKTRGQWGERMAEDVLRLAGFIENVNYRKQTAVEGDTGRPDFTFDLPKGHVLYMDVKFPLTSYLRYLEAGTDAERQAHLKRFLRDVRLRVKELAKRDYARISDDRPSTRCCCSSRTSRSAASSTRTTRPSSTTRCASTSSSARRCRCSRSSGSSARRSTAS